MRDKESTSHHLPRPFPRCLAGTTPRGDRFSSGRTRLLDLVPGRTSLGCQVLLLVAMGILSVRATPTVIAETGGNLDVPASSKPVEERLNLPGLEKPVEILRDRWGIAHIYA